jgi:tetratricopeptide (TPR) repeat protein
MELRTTLQQAAALLQAGRIKDSARLCRQVLAALPGQPDALHLLALAARNRGDSARADRLFRESIAAAPIPDVLLNHGIFLRGLGRLAEAEAQLRAALKLAPKLAAGWHNLGLLLYAAGELREAGRCARMLTSLEPARPAGWELLAAIQQKQGDNLAAIAACEQGLVHAPAASRLHYSRAQLLREESRFGEAAAAYGTALACGYETPDLYRNLAEALLESGELERALGSADAGIARYAEDALLHRTRARLHWETGAAGDPVAALARAARSSPRNPELWSTLVGLMNRLGREDESRAVLAEARNSGCPQTPDLLRLEALAEAHAGMSAAATAKFDQLLATYPQHTDSKLSFAQHLLATGDPHRAEALCSGILEQEPHNQLALAHLGSAWQMLGDARASWLLDYERMVRQVPVLPPSGYASTEAFFLDVKIALETLHRTQAHPIDQTLRGGTQTNGYLFRLKHPLLQVLETQIRSAVSAAIADFPQEASHPFWGRRIVQPGGEGFRFAGAWSVRLKSEGYHTNHIHPQGWISSALYVALPQEMEDAHDTAGHIQFGAPLDLPLPPRRIVRPEVGTLVLFPSYMWHGTVPFTSQQPRITVAFDLVPHN